MTTRSTPPPPSAPLEPTQLAATVAALPADVRPTFEALLRDPPGDLPALRAQIASHVARFDREAARNEFLSAREAKQLGALCHRLLDLYAHADEGRRRLVWALARYFVLENDADPDFGIGGIDDDVAVANAIAIALGHGDLCIDLDE